MSDYPEAIEAVLQQFNIDARIVNTIVGPSVTRYEMELGPGVKVQKITALTKQFAYQCAAESIRILAPIPGKAAVGIELPNADRSMISLADIPTEAHPLSVGVGVDVEGRPVTANLGKMPHLLVAGTTGSGKSSFINSMLVTLLEADPEQVNLLLIDPKQVELTPYNGVAHLIRPVVTEVDESIEALENLVQEMEDRYAAMQEAGVRHVEQLDGYPYIVAVVDELADLIMQAKTTVEPLIVRLLQKARAAGIHLVLATQRPSVDVVTGLIKTNAPSRLSFSTASLIDSRVILDEAGAEQLLGMGDGLFKPIGCRAAIRIQGAYVSDGEITAAVKKATAVKAVEAMVDYMQPPPPRGEGELTLIGLLDTLVQEAEASAQRGEEFLEAFCKKGRTLFGGGKAQMLTRAPLELGAATDSLTQLANDLKMLRQAAMEAA